MQTFLRGEGFGCSLEIPEHQPFLLDMWRALGCLTRDADKGLPNILAEGVETGPAKPIIASGVWDECAVDTACDDCVLRVFDTPWKSAK